MPGKLKPAFKNTLIRLKWRQDKKEVIGSTETATGGVL